MSDPKIPSKFVEVSPGHWAHPTLVKPNALTQSAEVYRVLSRAADASKPPKRIRQSTKPLMNKLESEFFSVLEERYLCYLKSPVLCQAVRFKLGNGIWYKPDFYVPPVTTAFEVKGPHAFRGGLENLKVAAHQYPNITWILVWKENGNWQEQEVFP